MVRAAHACGAMLAFFLFSPLAVCQSLSFSTDFDGTGNGSGFRIRAPHISSSPFSPSGGRNGSSSLDSYDQFLRGRYEDQAREAQRRADEERLRQELEQERAQRLQNVQRIQGILEKLQQLESDEPDVRQRMVYTQQVLDLEKQFDRARREYLNALPSYRTRLGWSLDHIVVPPPPHPLHYHRILIWGLLDTPEEARKAALSGIVDPFNGLPFDNIFAFGTNSVAGELERVPLDHILGPFGELSASTTRQLSALVGASAEEVVCHSNGCRVAEVLIATGKLRVKRLRVLGGDGALMDVGYLRQLIDQNHIEEISVYAIRGDQVPMIPTGWEIMDIMKKIGLPLQGFEGKINDLTYQALGITKNPGFIPNSQLRVHVLSYPATSDLHFIQKHIYETYARAISGWRRSGCLTDEGTTNQRCMI